MSGGRAALSRRNGWHGRRFYLVGVAGLPNYGDDLIVARWLSYLARRFPRADVWLDTPHPGPAAALFSEWHPHLTVTDTLFRLSGHAAEQSLDEVSHTIRAALAEPGHAPWWVAGIDAIKDSDVVHFVGGGFANDMWPHNLGVLASLGWVADHWRASVSATGVGITPLTPARAEQLSAAVRNFAIFDVRDAASLTAMEPLARMGGNLICSADDVFLDDPSASIDSATASGIDLGLVIQDDLREVDMADLIMFIRSRARDWQVAEDRIAFVECTPRVDARAFEAMAAEWPAARLISFQQVWQAGFPAGPHQRWISTRFHPHLIAASAGASGIAISVKPDYYGAKHQSLLDLGSGWAHTGPELDVTEATGPGRLVDNLAQLRTRKRSIARGIYEPDSRTASAVLGGARSGLGQLWGRLRGPLRSVELRDPSSSDPLGQAIVSDDGPAE